VRQYKKLFEMDDIELEFTHPALAAIAQIAIKRKTGARGLRSVIEKTMSQIMFEAPSDEYLTKVKINKATVVEGARPECVLSNPEETPTVSGSA